MTKTIDDILDKFSPVIQDGEVWIEKTKAELLLLLEQAAPEKERLQATKKIRGKGDQQYRDFMNGYHHGVDDYLANIREALK